MFLLGTTVSVSHARRPISQETGDMAKVQVNLDVEGVKRLAAPLAVPHFWN